MKCSKCGTTLIKRTGKFGDFLCCPKSNPSDNHGTISIVKSSSQVAYNKAYHSDDLLTAIKRRSVLFGAPIDTMQEIAEWIVDNEADCYDDLGEETDHWMNTRPY